MAQIILEYDKKSKKAQNELKVLLSKLSEVKVRFPKLDKALKEVENGDTVEFESVDQFSAWLEDV